MKRERERDLCAYIYIYIYMYMYILSDSITHRDIDVLGPPAEAEAISY